MSDEHQPSAHAFAREICRGNKAAEEFCHLFYRHAHALDDLIDTKEDGRPTMSNADILALFADTALMYSCPFFVANRTILFPVILMVLNQYADSVAWERDPIKHRRIMADVLRTCGDEVFFMVAMIVGGWGHMRAVSGRIRETDWLKQHDAEGRPT